VTGGTSQPLYIYIYIYIYIYVVCRGLNKMSDITIFQEGVSVYSLNSTNLIPTCPTGIQSTPPYFFLKFHCSHNLPSSSTSPKQFSFLFLSIFSTTILYPFFMSPVLAMRRHSLSVHRSATERTIRVSNLSKGKRFLFPVTA